MSHDHVANVQEVSNAVLHEGAQAEWTKTVLLALAKKVAVTSILAEAPRDEFERMVAEI